jgi:hypothetical protein
MPFRSQRDYWRSPDGKVLEYRETPGENDPGTLAE